MDIITIDGMVEHDFRHSVEDMLRLDQVDEAVERLQALVAPFSGVSGILPPCFLDAARRRVEIGGWNRLTDRVTSHDKDDRPITAIGITLVDATSLGGPGPSRGRLAPFIKTYYFSDDAYPFSNATRDDLLDGYSRDGFEWQGDYQATDATLTVRGLDDLYAPIFTLERQLLARSDPPEDEIRAGTIGACLIAVLIHRAIRDAIVQQGLPRPLCVIAACDGVYPLFDAPVAGVEASGGVLAEDENEGSETDGATGSLLNLITRSRDKTMALALSVEDAEEGHRAVELAEAHSLDVHKDHTPTHSIDLSVYHGASAPAWDDAAAYEDRPAPAGWAPPMPPAREAHEPLPDFLWPIDEPIDEDAEVLAGESAAPEARGFIGSIYASVERPMPRLESDEAEHLPENEDAPPTPPASHNLRARIALSTAAENQVPNTAAQGLGALFDRLLQFILRR